MRREATEILTRSVMVSGGGTFRRRLGHEGGSPMNGIRALVLGPQRALLPFPPCEDTEKMAIYGHLLLLRKKPLPDTESVGTLILGLLA